LVNSPQSDELIQEFFLLAYNQPNLKKLELKCTNCQIELDEIIGNVSFALQTCIHLESFDCNISDCSAPSDRLITNEHIHELSNGIKSLPKLIDFTLKFFEFKFEAENVRTSSGENQTDFQIYYNKSSGLTGDDAILLAESFSNKQERTTCELSLYNGGNEDGCVALKGLNKLFRITKLCLEMDKLEFNFPDGINKLMKILDDVPS